MISVRIDLKNYEQVRNTIWMLNLNKNGRARGAFKRSMQAAARKSWVDAVPKARIGRRTGKLLEVKSINVDKFSIALIPRAMHAKFFWYGTKRSLGRWIKYMWYYEPALGKYIRVFLGKRFKKSTREYYREKYGEKFVGYHPGIRISKFPLRRVFYEELEKNIADYLGRWLRRYVRKGGFV